MAAAGTSTSDQPRRRPANRKALILAAATEAFVDNGFDRVAMKDLGDAVGITAGALYRHFPSRDALLEDVIWQGLEQFWHAVSDRDLAATDPTRELTLMLTELAAESWERRKNPLLWRRESRHLGSSARHQVRARFDEIAAAATTLLRRARPDLSEVDAQVLVWACLSVLTSPAFHRISLPRGRYEALLLTMAQRVLAVSLPRVPASVDHPEKRLGLQRASRRELLLREAIPLFARQGFTATSTEQLGRAAGMSGPAVYEHFRSKSEILLTALRRADARLEMGLAKALREASDPQQALRALVADYAVFGIEDRWLTAVLINDVISLDDADRHALRSLQYDYVTEWVTLVREVTPRHSASEARFVVQAAMTIVNDLARIGQTRDRPALHAELVEIAMQVLATT